MLVPCHSEKAYQNVLTVVMKNCDPLESGPELTIETTPVNNSSQHAYKTLKNSGKNYGIR